MPSEVLLLGDGETAGERIQLPVAAHIGGLHREAQDPTGEPLGRAQPHPGGDPLAVVRDR